MNKKKITVDDEGKQNNSWNRSKENI